MARTRGGRLTVRITGIDRLRVALEQLPDDIKDELRRAVRESAEAVVEETRRTVPVGATGNLRDHVAAHPEDDGLRMTVGWIDAEDYYARFVEFGTRRMPARPSLGPALEAERGRYRARLSAAVRAVLR